jgi:AmmeMemoRadiSam system protein B
MTLRNRCMAKPLRFCRLFASFIGALAIVPISVADNPRVTGLVAPHHAVALDLVEEVFRTAEGFRYDRIILLSPDHFRRSRTPFATTVADFPTRFGVVKTDKPSVEHLTRNGLVSESDLFPKEHGVQVLLPFIARFFPDTPVVPVAIRIDSKPRHWEELIDLLDPVFDDRTLIVQSTDFSHYLDRRQARRHDQQTMNALATQAPEAIPVLNQPAHLDSVAAQYVHMRLQERRGHGAPLVLANRNSQHYSPLFERQTTSYITQVFLAGAPRAVPWPDSPDAETWIFAGDVFLGRNLTPILFDAEKRAALRDRVLSFTGGKPMVVNLEGVLLPSVPDPKSQRILAMPQHPVVDFLKSINVRIASLANNHAFDMGASGLENTAEVLRANGIHPLLEGEVHDAGRFRLTALTDFCNKRSPLGGRIGPDDVRGIPGSDNLRFPSIAILHWGKEFDASPQSSQLRIAEWLRDTPITLLAGSHPHVSSPRLQSWKQGDGLIAWSLGNLLFDQPRGSGALLEVRFFGNKTYATRLIPIGNLLTSQRTRASVSPLP